MVNSPPKRDEWGENESELMEASGFLLCGGRSSRMGRAKALLMLDGVPLVQRGLRVLGQVCREVTIAGDIEQELGDFGRVVPDQRPGCGPLGGIVSALEQSSSEWNLFLAVDMPFVPVAALNRLLSIAAGSAAVCVMARAGGRLQPLCAVYARKALPALKEQLESGNWKVTDAIGRAGIYEEIDFEEEAWFVNLNTPEEFTEAKSNLRS